MKLSYKIIPFDQVPYGSRFRLRGRWYKHSLITLNIGEYFSGFSMVKERITPITKVGVDLKFTPFDKHH